MHKWFLRSKTLWFNGLALFGLVAAGQPDFAGEVGVMLEDAGMAALVPLGNILTRFSTDEPMGAGGKATLRSKTMWWNLIMVAAGVMAFMAGNSTMGFVFIGLAAVNMILRGVTGTKVTLLPHRSAY